MRKAAQELTPKPLTPAEFHSSNVFVAYSRKMRRQIQVIGPTMYDSWLLVEFDVDMVAFCERPPLDVSLQPLKDNRRRPYDFWVRRRSGRHHGIVLYDAALAADRQVPLEVLQRSIADAGQACEVWLAADIQRRRTLLRNLKLLGPFVAAEAEPDPVLSAYLLDFLHRVGQATWADLVGHAVRWHGSDAHGEVARLIHAGRVSADLSTAPLHLSTWLRVP